MKENEILEDEKVEKVNGGAAGNKKVCDLCGGNGPFESYYITIKFTDGFEYLGRKRICLGCHDSHLKDYIRENYPGRSFKEVRMEGPLMN